MAGRFSNLQGKGLKDGRPALRLFLIALISGTIFAGVVFAADYAAGTYSSGTYGGGVYGTGDATPPSTAAPAPSGGGAQIFGSGPTAPGYVNTNPTGTSSASAITSAITGSTSPPTAPTTSSSSTPSVTAAPPSTSYQFTLNRQLWDEGSDILALQQWLNTHGFPLVSTGWGSPGNETDTFGLHTYAALIKFQEAHGLPATGFFGPLTRAAIAGMSTTSTAQ